MGTRTEEAHAILAQRMAQWCGAVAAFVGNLQQGGAVADVFAAHEVGGKQALQQGIQLCGIAQGAGVGQQAVGIGGVGHAGNLLQVDADSGPRRRFLYLRLALAHGCRTAQSLQVKIGKRHAAGGHVR